MFLIYISIGCFHKEMLSLAVILPGPIIRVLGESLHRHVVDDVIQGENNPGGDKNNTFQILKKKPLQILACCEESI